MVDGVVLVVMMGGCVVDGVMLVSCGVLLLCVVVVEVCGVVDMVDVAVLVEVLKVAVECDAVIVLWWCGSGEDASWSRSSITR